MCPQAPRSSPEYSHKAGLQTVITLRPHGACHNGLNSTCAFMFDEDSGIGRPRRRPSSCSMLDEGWKLPVALLPLVQ
jgi:hypothetical protein